MTAPASRNSISRTLISFSFLVGEEKHDIESTASSCAYLKSASFLKLVKKENKQEILRALPRTTVMPHACFWDWAGRNVSLKKVRRWRKRSGGRRRDHDFSRKLFSISGVRTGHIENMQLEISWSLTRWITFGIETIMHLFMIRFFISLSSLRVPYFFFFCSHWLFSLFAYTV